LFKNNDEDVLRHTREKRKLYHMTNIKKISLLATSALAVLELGTTAPTVAHAADSTASVIFQPNTKPTNPVDPENPDNPFTPDKPATGENGPLSIDYVSDFNFGTQDITTKDATYSAALTSGKDSSGAPVTKPNYVQITDNTGSSLGWSLNVKQVAQLASGANALQGAQISLANLEAVTNSASNAVAPTVAGGINLIPGTVAKVTTADANQGEGTWVTRFGKDATEGASAVSLSVPGASVKKAATYTSTLQWTLSSTPDANNAI
jgi:hypothetical protein